MKISKLIFSTLFIIAIAATSVFAQRKGEAMIEKKMAHITETLELNDKQQAEIKVILEKGMEKQIALKEKEGDRASKKEAFKAIKEEQLKAIEAILTKEQLATFEAEKEAMKEKRMARKEQAEKVDRKALKAEMEAYMNKNIRPVLQEKRAKFDQQLTSSEKQTISEVRAKLAAQKEKFDAAKKNRKKGEKPSEEERTQMKAKFKAQKEAMKTEMDKVKTIAEKYDTQLKAIHEGLSPQTEKWKADMKKIAEKHGIKHEKGDMKGKRGQKGQEEKRDGEHGKRGHRGRRGPKGMHLKEMSPVGFLLMNPDEAPQTAATENTKTYMKVFPNPAQSFNNIEFTLATAGDISIELHDQEGNLVKSVLNEYRPAGQHTVRVNLGGLSGFVYLYILKDAEGNVVTEKFVIRK